MNLVLPSLDFQPSYISKVNSWHHHLHFAYDLVANVRPKTLVELGVHYGDSFFTFCQSVSDLEIDCKCFGVDRWTGELHSGFYDEEVWDIVSNYNHANYDFARLLRKDFSSALGDFPKSSIELLHIDGCHTYEAIRDDFYNWLPKVSDKGIILLHDIQERRHGFGVWKLWQELKSDFETFTFPFGHGLGLIFKDNNFAHDNEFLHQLLVSEPLKLYYKSKSENLPYISSVIPGIELNTEDDENLRKSIHENVLLNDKIRRMQNSFSWRITSPIRFLRRKVLDPYLRKDSFDARLYLQLNPDLQKIYRDDYKAAANHFKRWGKKQGRMYLNVHQSFTYSEWIARFDVNDTCKLEKYRIELSNLTELPLLSIIIPIFNSNLRFLKASINSVFDQIYPNWELILVDDHSCCKKLSSFLTEIEGSDRRIRLVRRRENGHISEACNSGLELVSGSHYAVLDHDDLLREHTLLRICQAINKNPNCKIIYSDEDKINHKEERTSPHLKPDWNPELLLSQNYICHVCFLETSFAKKIGGYRPGFEGCQDWDLFLRISESIHDREIVHISEILYHWRKSKHSTASKISNKNYVYENSLKVIKEAWERRDIAVSVESVAIPNNYVRTKFLIPKILPLVSIIIPTRDNLEHLEKCINGLLHKTSYPKLEILVMNNDSKDYDVINYLKKLRFSETCRVVDVPGEFNFSKICNDGVKESHGEQILLLNDDVEPINTDWLSEMVAIANREEVGCVGAKLLYPNDTIQHAGIILGVGGFAGHAFRRFPKSHDGYSCRLNLVQNYSAVTGACLLVRKKIFTKVSGLNEDCLKVAFNDVDFCLKVLEAGYRNVWTPHALLYHYESASRGNDFQGNNYKRFLREGNYIYNRWKRLLENDPAYNRNLSLNVEDFSIALPRKVQP